MFCLGLLTILGSLMSIMAMKSYFLRTLRVVRLSTSSMHSFVPSSFPCWRHSDSSRLMMSTSTSTGTEGGRKETSLLGRRRLFRIQKQPIMPKVMIDNRKEEEVEDEEEVEEDDAVEEEEEEFDEDEDDDYDDEEEQEGDTEAELGSVVGVDIGSDRSRQYAVPEVDEATNEFSRLGLLSGIVQVVVMMMI